MWRIERLRGSVERLKLVDSQQYCKLALSTAQIAISLLSKNGKGAQLSKEEDAAKKIVQ